MAKFHAKNYIKALALAVTLKKVSKIFLFTQTKQR
jgi:hypothetical protein